MLEVGMKPKDFQLKDAFGKTHKLSDYLGKKVVLYFYPKDNTPGCTTQACSFRDIYQELTNENVVLLGISTDDAMSHKNFIESYNLPFVLLSDPDHEVSSYFGSYGEKNLYGKITIGMKRSTFILNEEGVIEKVFKKASAKTNASAVLTFIKG
ncbi:peroxiredoxin Q/BCP [Acholeplasma morum]|uniref:thioredoxin-dependent thiol peroxidase n=1 Tax=Paracholeplasma morum TaxID=264637 RepID=UPI00195973FB|nr:thioredoxin-dependent thiol peroxidase [Paracholeplasma morum]MBM7453386.1 peroxiredoxin Q/BCP [Paracholeplasma morum]